MRILPIPKDLVCLKRHIGAVKSGNNPRCIISCWPIGRNLSTKRIAVTGIQGFVSSYHRNYFRFNPAPRVCIELNMDCFRVKTIQIDRYFKDVIPIDFLMLDITETNPLPIGLQGFAPLGDKDRFVGPCGGSIRSRRGWNRGRRPNPGRSGLRPPWRRRNKQTRR